MDLPAEAAPERAMLRHFSRGKARDGTRMTTEIDVRLTRVAAFIPWIVSEYGTRTSNCPEHVSREEWKRARQEERDVAAAEIRSRT